MGAAVDLLGCGISVLDLNYQQLTQIRQWLASFDDVLDQ